MHTSRAQLDRILKPRGNVATKTLHRTAALLGRELRLELIQPDLMLREGKTGLGPGPAADSPKRAELDQP